MKCKTTSAAVIMALGLGIGITSGCAKTQTNPGGTPTPAIRGSTATESAAYAKNGFYTSLDERDGRLWVFKKDSDDLAKFKTEGRPARHVLRPGAGPDGLTLKSTESETIIEYITAKDGFYTTLDKDGRLWIFRADSRELDEYRAKGLPAKHVVRPGAGPLGLTIKSVDTETLDAYRDAD